LTTQGERIKKIRQELKLSQQDLGDILDVSKQFVSNVETNRKILNNDKLVILLVDHNISADYVLAGVGSMFIKKEVAKNDDLENLIEKTFNNYLGKLGLTDEEISRRLSAGMPTPKNEK